MKIHRAIVRFVPVGAIALSVGCSHGTKNPSTSATPSSSATYQAALDKAFGDLEATSYRAPAQSSGIVLQQLNKLSPGKFKVFVFPKLSSMVNKTNADKKLFKNAADERASQLGRPSQFEVSTIAENPCAQFTQKNLFAKYKPKEFFDGSLAADSNRRCAIVEITSLNLKNANRSLVKRDDVMAVRLFLDDTYTLRGYEMDKFESSRKLVTIRVKSEGQVASSGLSLFPMDIPTMDVLARPSAKRGSVDVNNRIDKLAISQIRKASGAFKPVQCAGSEIRYQDYYGTPVEVGWCNNLPFPQYMENGRFVAITQSLSVR